MCSEISVVWANHEYILSRNLFTHVEKMEDYERDLLCSRLSCVSRHQGHVGKRTSLCQRDLWGCNDCMHLVFSSPFLGCPSLLPPALLESPERLLELVLQTKVSLLGPVSRLYTTIEPFLPALSCSHDHICLTFMHTFICW